MHDTASPIYLPLRLVHMLGAMVFLGALTVSLWLKLRADRSGDAGYAGKLHRTLRKLDGQIIGPFAIVTFASGYSMVRFLGGRISQHFFVLFSLIWMFLALGLWYFGMRNLGDKLAEDAEAAEGARQPMGAEYAKRSAAWVACAAGAIFFVVLAAVFMVFKLPAP